ncbi:MAG: hypothetical protein A2Y57_00445 [Candidatus Woykebacteria bacterium RBG_13_40_7b]|uniref:Uncharacterized protein n=1 Tax=Candidatus Woykebacteria bacterium RBG_13_40_7b TaxID=1802594 RepID=A0A1G1WAG9_9BACT|nr:MAG: hypothetical protein A2Y57_00445 [Candidatus Woykebacteria bacterium RBG_13_40_7b]
MQRLLREGRSPPKSRGLWALVVFIILGAFALLALMATGFGPRTVDATTISPTTLSLTEAGDLALEPTLEDVTDNTWTPAGAFTDEVPSYGAGTQQYWTTTDAVNDVAPTTILTKETRIYGTTIFALAVSFVAITTIIWADWKGTRVTQARSFLARYTTLRAGASHST